MSNPATIDRSSNSMKQEWLNLSQTAQLLGVHPGTLRVWANQGVIPVHRTKGGHRRFNRAEIELWQQTQVESQKMNMDSLIQSAIHTTRLHVSEGSLEKEEWYNKLNEEAREQYRLAGRHLYQGLLNYLNASDSSNFKEAHALGYEYALRARRYQLNIVEAAQAFYFFRNMLTEAMLTVYENAAVRSASAWSEMFRKTSAFTDQIMIALLETFQAYNHNGKG
ncbi:MAG: MerR family transcriptional regulator [Anaerolineales bacterium]